MGSENAIRNTPSLAHIATFLGRSEAETYDQYLKFRNSRPPSIYPKVNAFIDRALKGTEIDWLLNQAKSMPTANDTQKTIKKQILDILEVLPTFLSTNEVRFKYAAKFPVYPIDIGWAIPVKATGLALVNGKLTIIYVLPWRDLKLSRFQKSVIFTILRKRGVDEYGSGEFRILLLELGSKCKYEKRRCVLNYDEDFVQLTVEQLKAEFDKLIRSIKAVEQHLKHYPLPPRKPKKEKGSTIQLELGL